MYCCDGGQAGRDGCLLPQTVNICGGCIQSYVFVVGSVTRVPEALTVCWSLTPFMSDI